MHYVFPIIGIILSVAMLKYRERLGDFMGEAEWMRYVGGVYTFVIILALFVFLWSLAVLTGTTTILFEPFLYLLPGNANPNAREFIPQNVGGMGVQ
jgi:uncharacterized membrane protein